MATQLIDVKTAARMLTVSDQCVYNWISTGKLDEYRVGRLIRIDRSQIDAILQPVAKAVEPVKPATPAVMVKPVRDPAMLRLIEESRQASYESRQAETDRRVQFDLAYGEAFEDLCAEVVKLVDAGSVDALEAGAVMHVGMRRIREAAASSHARRA